MPEIKKIGLVALIFVIFLLHVNTLRVYCKTGSNNSAKFWNEKKHTLSQLKNLFFIKKLSKVFFYIFHNFRWSKRVWPPQHEQWPRLPAQPVFSLLHQSPSTTSASRAKVSTTTVSTPVSHKHAHKLHSQSCGGSSVCQLSQEGHVRFHYVRAPERRQQRRRHQWLQREHHTYAHTGARSSATGAQEAHAHSHHWSLSLKCVCVCVR